GPLLETETPVSAGRARTGCTAGRAGGAGAAGLGRAPLLMPGGGAAIILSISAAGAQRAAGGRAPGPLVQGGQGSGPVAGLASSRRGSRAERESAKGCRADGVRPPPPCSADSHAPERESPPAPGRARDAEPPERPPTGRPHPAEPRKRCRKRSGRILPAT